MDQLTCQICGDKLAFNPECPCSLGEHLLSRHPELEMAHFSREDLFCRCSSERIPQDHAPKKKPSPSVRFRTKSRSGQALFKTTVETWRPGPRMVTCPQCNYLERPCIRKQRNRVAYSTIGALCLLLCWPICFLPFFLPHGSDIELFCKKCGAFLGRYDRQTGTMTCPPCPPVNGKNVNDKPPMC